MPDETRTEKSSDKWKRKFAAYLKQDRERLAAARFSSAKPKFNAAAWRHRPLGEPKERTNISEKEVAHA